LYFVHFSKEEVFSALDVGYKSLNVFSQCFLLCLQRNVVLSELVSIISTNGVNLAAIEKRFNLLTKVQPLLEQAHTLSTLWTSRRNLLFDQFSFLHGVRAELLELKEKFWGSVRHDHALDHVFVWISLSHRS
jgi:hypothetical protein